MKLLKNLWHIPSLVLIELLLFLTNYKLGTSLLGWDGLYPELNFPLNLQRNIFAIWQEYRGVGLYDGMSYASNLPHTLFLWLLSFVLPQDVLRYFFIFLMHAVGVVGMYMLLNKLFRQKIVASVSALFYGYNIGILQMFYAPLEVFAIHFAFLPLLTVSLLNFLQTPSLKKLSLFAFFSFLATPQGFVPQIFISYLLLIFAILTVYVWVRRRSAVPYVLSIIAVIFCTNAFWLLPYIGGIPQNAPVILDSKINQMASNTIYQMNKNRGDLLDVLTLKGFMLDTAEYSNGTYGYIMQKWRDYTATPLFILPSLFFIALWLSGLYAIIKSKHIGLYPFVVTSSVTFFFLGNDIPILDLLNALLRYLLPVFNEAFRFPFTKFETLFVFSYTIVLTTGLTHLSFWLKQNLNKKFPIFNFHFPVNFPYTKYHMPNIPYSSIFSCVLLLLLFLYAFPVFEGHFLFASVRIPMEPDYNALIHYLNNQPFLSRIATLPQPTFYNWEYHTNNYRGSGFLWYGLPQATLERSFDPWSNYNENYYWELSQAIYSNNATALQKVFEKYQVGYILLDENIIYPFAPRSLQISQTKALLKALGAKEIKQFGKAALYTLSSSPVFTATNLPTVNPYQWTDEDTFYQLHGTYITQDRPAFTLPFRSLFTNQPNSQFSTTQSPISITFSTLLPTTTSTITLPSLTQLEPFTEASLLYSVSTKTVSLIATTPQISLDNQTIPPQRFTYPLFSLPPTTAFPVTITLNAEPSLTLSSPVSKTLGTLLIPLNQDSLAVVKDKLGNTAKKLIPRDLLQEALAKPQSISLSQNAKPLLFTVTVPKTSTAFSPSLTKTNVADCSTITHGTIQFAKDNNTPEGILLSSENADSCLSFFDQNAQSSQGYILAIKSKYISGMPLSFWAEDPFQQFAFLNAHLPNDQKDTTSYFVLPQRENNNQGYGFHIENISLGQTQTMNTLEQFALYPIPSNFLTHILTDTGVNPHGTVTTSIPFNHPNPSLYVLPLVPQASENTTLVLSQAFDNGWHAYTISTAQSPLSNLQSIFPFLLGKELKDHVKVNNWENGWVLSYNQQRMAHNTQIILVFLPQYLEYFGFVLLILLFLFFCIPSAILIRLKDTLIPFLLKKNPLIWYESVKNFLLQDNLQI